MANEIEYTVRLKLNRPSSTNPREWKTSTQKVDQSGTNYTSGTQSIGTSAEAITLLDTANSGYAYFRNTDGTNYVEIGDDPGTGLVPFVKLKAGEAAVLRLATDSITTIKAKANTSAVDLEFAILED